MPREMTDSDIVAQLTANRLGPAKDAAAAAAAAQGPNQQPDPAQTKQGQPKVPGAKDEKATSQEQAVKAAAQKEPTEQEAVAYEIDFGGGQKRKLTPQQISASMTRYAGLNFKHAQLKPVIDVVEKLIQANPGMTPNDISQRFISAITKASEKNPTMGDQKAGRRDDPPPDDAGTDDEALTRWEQENAAALPPGYKQLMKGNKETGTKLDQVMSMLQRVMAGSQGVADAARAAHGDATKQNVEAIRTQIGTNLDRVQAHLQIPDDSAEDFMAFAGERGYTLEDFVDVQLTLKVMSDFKNALGAPEMDRIRDVAKRRQSYTGSLGSTPGQGAAAQGEQPKPTTFDVFSQGVLEKKGMV